MSIRQLFKGEIFEESIEGEKIELLFPTSFLDGIQKLGITDFSDLDNACLMNVLAKPQLENTILLDEVIDIMQNLGIPDDEGGENPTQQEPEETEGSPDPAPESKPRKKGMDINTLSDESKNLLLNFLIVLESENLTVSQFFSEVKYQQMVKTKKNKPSSVDIVPAEDFFRLMESNFEIISDVNLTDEVRNELTSLL